MSRVRAYCLILLAVIVAYGTSLRYGFSQDDWYFLLISRASSVGDLFGFFNPLSQSGFAFFRPLSTQLYYYLFQANPFSMHLFMLLVQSLNGYLVYRLVSRLRSPNSTALIIGLLYAFSSVHFLSLYYIAATQQLLAAGFAFLSLILFLDRRYFLSVGVFVLALLSKETAIITPAVAFILLYLQKEPIRWRVLVPYGLIVVGYLVFRLTTHTGVQSEYGFYLGPSVLTNLRWYVLFAGNYPEMLVSYGLPRMGINLGSFITDYGWRAGVITIFSTAIVLWVMVRLWVSRRWLYALWFVVGLTPVIFLRNHLYPHYLDLSLVPFLFLLLLGVKPKTQTLLVAVYLLTSLLAITVSVDQHWTTGRALMAQTLYSRLNWSELCQFPALAFVGSGNAPREASYTLSLANGPRVICAKPTLEVYYAGVDHDIPASATQVDLSWINDL